MTRCKVCPWYGPDDVAWLHAWRHLSPDCRPTASRPGSQQTPAPGAAEVEGSTSPGPAAAPMLDPEGGR